MNRTDGFMNGGIISFIFKCSIVAPIIRFVQWCMHVHNCNSFIFLDPLSFLDIFLLLAT